MLYKKQNGKAHIRTCNKQWVMVAEGLTTHLNKNAVNLHVKHINLCKFKKNLKSNLGFYLVIQT